MRLHANARLSLKGRELLVDRVERAGWSLTKAAEAAGVSERTAGKWLARHRAEGPAGLLDRSSAPARVANRTDERRVEAIAALRRLRMTGAEIAEVLDMALSTVSAILTRIGMGKLGRVGLEPAQRYERQRPGELIHIDVKKIGRIARPGHRVLGRQRAGGHHRRRYDQGWEFVHIAIDDATRLAYVEVLSDEKDNHGRRLPQPRGQALRLLRHHRRAVAHRQRQRLPLHRARDRLPRPGDPPPAHPPLPPADQRQGLCLSVVGPSGWAARLPAPVGLTQAKGMPMVGSVVGPGRGRPRWPPTGLRSICRPAGCGRAGEADLIGEFAPMWLHRHRSVARRPGLDSIHEPGGHLVRRYRRSQAHPRRRADR
jgi:transposase